MHWMDWSGGGWFMMIFWWVIVIGVVYLVVKAITGQRSDSRREDSAPEILRKRYARGEISKEEFEAKKKDLI
jgi:putative membrane protein